MSSSWKRIRIAAEKVKPDVRKGLRADIRFQISDFRCQEKIKDKGKDKCSRKINAVVIGRY